MATTATSTANPLITSPIYGGAAQTSTPVASAPASVLSPQGTTKAPAVVTATPASSVANTIKSNLTSQVNAGGQNATAKSSGYTTTYDANGNMIQTSNAPLANGQPHTITTAPGSPGYVPNPATVAATSATNAQNAQTSALTTAAAPITGQVDLNNPGANNPNYSAPTATNSVTGQPVTPNGTGTVQIPTGIDPTTTTGLATWYNQDPNGFEEYATQQGMTQAQQFQVQVDAGNQQIQSIQTQGNQYLSEYLSGTFPLTASQQAQVAALQQMWNGTISAQQQANSTYLAASAMASARAGGQYDPTGSLGEAQQSIATGLDRITQFQGLEQQQINAMIQGFQDNDYKAVTDNLALQEKTQQDITDNLATVNTAITKANEDAQTQANYVATTQYNEVTKPIQDITEQAVANGAKGAQLAAIKNATTVDDALSAAGDLLQTSTDPTIEAYLEYKRTLPTGSPAMDFTAFQEEQNQLDINKAAATAYATEAAKNSADEASGIPTSKQQTAIDNANGVLKTSPEATDFVTTAQSYLKILDLGNSTDPATQSALLAAFIQMAVPGSKTLRGNAQVITSDFGNTLQDVIIGAQKTVADRGNLNAQDVAAIQDAASKMYQSQYQSYQPIVQALIPPLQKEGLNDAAGYLDDMSQPFNSAVIEQQANTSISNFASQSAANYQQVQNDLAIGTKSLGRTPTYAELLQAFPELGGTSTTNTFNNSTPYGQ